MNIPKLVATIEACDSLQDMKVILEKVAAQFDFSGFNFIDVGQPHLEEPFYLGNTSPKWEGEYKANRFATFDPVMHAARRVNLPFRWSDVVIEPRRSGPKPAEIRVMEAARDFGFTDGWIVPLHLVDRRGRSSSCCTCFFWSGPIQKLKFLLLQDKYDLQIATIYWTEKLLSLREKQRAQAAPDEEAGGSKLSDREREVLTWAARGKTAEDTAEIMHLSVLTVRTHVKNSIAKLSANSTTHAVALALRQGRIDI